MKLIKFETQSENGVHFVIKIQTAEDIWHLYHLVEIGDEVRSTTTRKVSKETSGGSVSEKKHMTLNIRSTAVNYDNEGGFLRVSGQNRTVSEWVAQNAQHTLQIGFDPPHDVGVTKQNWDSVHEERLALACDDSATADVAALLCAPGQANYFLVNGSMTSLKARLRVNISKKKKMSGTARDESLARFYQQLLEMMVSYTNLQVVKVLLFAGPQNLREEFFKFFSTKAQRDDASSAVKALYAARSKILPCDASSTLSLREVMSDPSIQEKLHLTAHSEDVKLWEEFNLYLNTQPDKVTYGLQCVFAAHKGNHAVDKLLVSDAAVREGSAEQRVFLTELIDEVRELGGTAHVFSSRHYVGEQLGHMGGVAAILRIPLEGLEDEIVIDKNFVKSEAVNAWIRERGESKKQNAKKSLSSNSDK